jgi:DNA-binding Xre family transcriptional regulator
MSWAVEAQERRFPEVQLGFEILGAAVKRRRIVLGWSQRELERASGVDQTIISRLERGILRGIRFSRFARLVAAMNGLDVDRPHPRPPRPMWWD